MSDLAHFWVVEPHADDAFISMGGHLEAWHKAGHRTTIVTVYSATRRRGREAAEYAHAVGADWVGLGLVENDGGTGGPAPDPLPAGFFDGIGDGPGQVRVWPLGMRHPEHRQVAACAGDEWRYLDHHSMRDSGEAALRLHGRRVVSYLRPTGRKWRHTAVFADQRRFFHYNPPDRLVGVELVVS